MQKHIDELIHRDPSTKLPKSLNRKQQHIHKYELFDYGRHGAKTFRCVLTDCPHFLPQINLAIGRLTQCWGTCGKSFELDNSHLNTKRPMCPECKEARKMRIAMQQFLPDESDL